MFMDSAGTYIFIYPSGGIPELAEDPSLTDAVTEWDRKKKQWKQKRTGRVII